MFYVKVIKFFMIIKIMMDSIVYKKKAFIFCTPIHGNLGDQALLYAEESFFKITLPKVKIIEVESSIVRRFPKFLKKLVGKNDIYIQAGGFLGNLWLNEENSFRVVLKNFIDNRVVVLPQTIFFTDDEEGKTEYQKSKIIYESHPNLHFFLREKYSYDFMREKFEKCDIHLLPDMALYLDSSCLDLKDGSHRCDALMCLRRDKEKIDNNYNDVIEALNQAGLNHIKYTDTVINKHIYSYNRKKELSKKISEFYDAKIVITDRLHGMIFALIAGTPCLVFKNKNYKIIGVYEWIKSFDSIKLHQEHLQYLDEIKQLLGKKIVYQSSTFKGKYLQLLK